MRSAFAQPAQSAELRLSPAAVDRRTVDVWFARVGGALDGVVAKRLHLAYVAGMRDGGVKVKKQRSADCVIGGFRLAAGEHEGVGSLLLGLYDAAGLLDYIGFCSAFPTAERRALLTRLDPLRDVSAGFTGGAPGDAPSRWSHDPSAIVRTSRCGPNSCSKSDSIRLPAAASATVRAHCAGAPTRRRARARPISWRSQGRHSICSISRPRVQPRTRPIGEVDPLEIGASKGFLGAPRVTHHF
jgi:hypothetical protein